MSEKECVYRIRWLSISVEIKLEITCHISLELMSPQESGRWWKFLIWWGVGSGGVGVLIWVIPTLNISMEGKEELITMGEVDPIVTIYACTPRPIYEHEWFLMLLFTLIYHAHLMSFYTETSHQPWSCLVDQCLRSALYFVDCSQNHKQQLVAVGV